MHRRQLLLRALAAGAGWPVRAAAADCIAPYPPAPYSYNEFVWRNVIEPGADGQHLRLVNALGLVEDDGLYSLVLAGYDAGSNRVALLTAYHNLSYFVDQQQRIPIERVRDYLLQQAPTRHRAFLSRELEAIPGAVFCRDDAPRQAIGTLRMVDLQTPAINDRTFWPNHPVDIALLSFELDPAHMLNVTELFHVDAGFRINARYESYALPRLVDGRDAIALTGWGAPFSGELQRLAPSPQHSHALYHGQPQPLAHPHRSVFSLSTLGKRLDLSGFSGGGVFLRDGGRLLLLGILSGTHDDTQLFTNLYRSAYLNLLDWLHDSLAPFAWKLGYAR